MQGAVYFGHPIELIPLPTRGFDIDAIRESFPRYEELVELSSNLETYEQVCVYEAIFLEYRAFVQGRLLFGSPAWEVFGRSALTYIKARKQQLICEEDVRAKRYYEKHLSFTEDETVNGYRLMSVDLSTRIEFETFLFIHEQWDNGDKDMDDVKFVQWLEENCCTDWNKQDRHGTCFGGFWRCEKGTYEHDNAYTLSREDNFKGLCELPFPRWIIMETVNWGCHTREESVRFSNFCCVWLERKREQMLPSLRSLATRVIEAKSDISGE
jgi:hypothetical protein